MLIRNFKSSADEIAKRNLADELLKVEISNAAILDDRISAYKNPNKPPPVPPEYKSQSDMLKDTIKLEKDAIDGLMDIKFDYKEAAQIVLQVKDLGGEGNDTLVKLVTGLPFIKADLAKKFNTKLITPEFFKNYFKNYLEDLSVSFGFSFNKDNLMNIASIGELKYILPTKDLVDAVSNLLDSVANKMDERVFMDIKLSLDKLFKALPSNEILEKMPTLSTALANKFLKQISSVIRKARIPTPDEFKAIENRILRMNQENNFSISNSIAEDINARLSYLTTGNLIQLEEISRELATELKINDKLIEEERTFEDITGEPISVKSTNEADLANVLHYIDSYMRNPNDYNDVFPKVIRIMEHFGLEDLQPNVGRDITLNQLKAILAGTRDKKGISNNKVIEGLKNAIEGIIAERINKPEPPYYELTSHELYEDPVNPSFGFGMTAKAVKKHFKEDEKFLKTTAKRLKKVKDDSSSDDEVITALKKHSKAEKPYEEKIEKALAQASEKKVTGNGYIHKRIPIKKVVGKGIEVEEQPTYKRFGKYVIHIPFLTDKNVLNVKYPSLGAVPSIKPMTVSDDYKDFVLDVITTGRPNEKVYKQLNDFEQKHFERICKGAGLIDTFKLKRSGDDEDKKDIDRFNLLRGNYLGGNNSPDVIKELKWLVIKFINEGKINRNEGYNLLMELSII